MSNDNNRIETLFMNNISDTINQLINDYSTKLISSQKLITKIKSEQGSKSGLNSTEAEEYKRALDTSDFPQLTVIPDPHNPFQSLVAPLIETALRRPDSTLHALRESDKSLFKINHISKHYAGMGSSLWIISITNEQHDETSIELSHFQFINENYEPNLTFMELTHNQPR
ncbi:hypothetical protein AB4254_11050 [Vibrio breoganii]